MPSLETVLIPVTRKVISYAIAMGILGSLQWALVMDRPDLGVAVLIATSLLLVLVWYNEKYGTSVYS